MSYSYSYKSSSKSGGPGGSSYSYESSGPQGQSSYSYQSSSNSNSGATSAGMPRGGNLSNDAEFEAAKMQAMMGAPMHGNSGGNSSSYSYKSSSSSNSSAMPTATAIPVSSGFQTDVHSAESQMEKMKREMESSMGMGLGHQPSGNSGSSYSYHHESSSSSGSKGSQPARASHHPETSSGGQTVKKTVTTTTTRTNPEAVRELERIEKDFNRMGRTPENYHDDFDKIRKEILTGEAYKGSNTTQEPVVTKMREEYTRSSNSSDHGSKHVPVHHGSGHSGNQQSSSSSSTTTRSYSSGGNHGHNQQHGETYIPISRYDRSFDDFHRDRWMDHKDSFGSFGQHDLDLQRMAWENRLGGIRNDFFSFPSHHDMSSSSSKIDSSKTVNKPRRPLNRSETRRTTRTYFVNCVTNKRNPMGKPEFAVQFEMREFSPEDINISTRHGQLEIKATREEKSGGSVSRREFSRTVDLPEDVQVNLMRSVFSRDGVLSITAPIKPPHYNPNPEPQSICQTSSPWSMQQSSPNQTYETSSRREEHSTQSSSSNYQQRPQQHHHPQSLSVVNNSSHQYASQHSPQSSTRVQAGSLPQQSHSSTISKSNDSQQSNFTYTLSVVGFKTEDINITIWGRKVKVHAKHSEQNALRGSRTYNEFTKMFDLPHGLDVNDLACYIQDGHTLFIRPRPLENVQGRIEFVPYEVK